jgi:murein DD-endopeptidase MepM/ murein hydrolase activator NlpD
MFVTTRKALLAAVLAFALVAGLTTASFADSKRDLEKKKDAVKGELKDAKKSYDESSAKFAAAVEALNAAQAKLDAAEATLGATRGALAAAEARDAEMQAKLERTEKALKKAIKELKKGEAAVEKTEASIEQFTVETLEQGDRGMRAVSGLLQGQDPGTFSEQMSLNESVGDAQLARMQELEATKVMLELRREKVEELRDQAAEQREEAAANLIEKQALEAEAEAQAASVAELVATRQKASGEAEAVRREDQALYQARVREAQALEAKLRALAKKDLKSGGKGSGGDGGSMLTRPVPGPITSPYGMRVHPVTGVYKLHDGTDFGVGCGVPIKAAASGTVVQQYFNGAYGNRVILNNGIMRGKSVVTTYNHLSRFAVSAGSKVKRGQVIGYVGSTGYSTGCHLHFMVLANGSTTQPMNWL